MSDSSAPDYRAAAELMLKHTDDPAGMVAQLLEDVANAQAMYFEISELADLLLDAGQRANTQQTDLSNIVDQYVGAAMWRNNTDREDVSITHRQRNLLLDKLRPDLSNYGKLMKKFGGRTGWPNERALREKFKKKDLKKLLGKVHVQ